MAGGDGRGGPARRPTLEDVAAAAGVSRALVSIVVRGAPGASASTRERVLAVAAELGYRPDARARLLAQGWSRLLGVTVAMDDPFHAAVVAGIYDAADGAGYEVVLSAITERRSERRAVETLLDYRCAAVVLLGAQGRGGWLPALAERLPVVSVGQPAGRARVDVVRTADEDGGGQAVEHLVGLGHRRIAHVDGGRAAGSADRRRGYRSAMRRHGLADLAMVVPGGGDESAGHGAWAEMQAVAEPPTAVFCYSDRTAVGLLEAAHRAGVAVPAELSIVGYDDTPLARRWPVDLTSVAQDTAGLAALAVRRAVTGAEAGARGAERGVGEIVLPPRLVARRSTGPPPR